MLPRKLALMCATFAFLMFATSPVLAAQFFILGHPLYSLLSIVFGGLSFAMSAMCLYPEWFLKVSDHE